MKAIKITGLNDLGCKALENVYTSFNQGAGVRKAYMKMLGINLAFDYKNTMTINFKTTPLQQMLRADDIMLLIRQNMNELKCNEKTDYDIEVIS